MNDYFDRIERQLVERTCARAGVPALRLLTPLRVTHPEPGTVAVSLATIAGLAVIGTFLVLLAPSPKHRATATRNASLGAKVALQRAFPVLATPRSDADRLPARLMSVLRHRRLSGLALNQSRLIVESHGVALWLIPGRGWVCAAVATDQARVVGAGCDRLSNARRLGFVSLRGSNTLIGVLPSGSSDVTVIARDGRKTDLSPSVRGGLALHSVTPLAQASWTGPTGAAGHLTLGTKPRLQR